MILPRKTESKLIAKLPAKDIPWVHCTDRNNCEWLISSKPDRSCYFLYRFVPGGYELVDKGQSPMDFYDIVYPPEPEPKRTRKRSS